MPGNYFATCMHKRKQFLHCNPSKLGTASRYNSACWRYRRGVSAEQCYTSCGLENTCKVVATVSSSAVEQLSSCPCARAYPPKS